MNESLEHGRALLERAQGDGRIYRAFLHKGEIPEWGLGFHAQQAEEKALKSVLSSHGIKYPYTHDLQTLVNLIGHKGLPLPPRSGDLSQLTPFGTVMRYEALLDEEVLEGLDWKEIGSLVEEVLTWARQSL